MYVCVCVCVAGKGIGEKGMIALAQALEVNTRLQTLDLRGKLVETERGGGIKG